MRKIIEFFIKRPLIGNIVTLFVLVMGYVSMTQINKEGYPKIDRKQLYITVIYPGASPEEVEANVTIPCEDAIKSIDGIEEFTSISRENYVQIHVIIDQEYRDAEKVKNDIRRALDNTSLPSETLDPDIFEWKVSAFPVIEIGIYSDTLTYRQIRERALDLERRLKILPDVSTVRERGILDREIKIKLNLDALNANYISIQEVIQTIQANNFEIAGGVYEQNGVDKIITVSSRLKSVNDVGNIILRSTFEGHKIYLRDVARIENGFETESVRFRMNGQNGVALQVAKKDTSDIVKTVDTIYNAVDEYLASLNGEDLKVVYLWDMSVQTRDRLKIVTGNAVLGLILVVIILFLFMDIRNAFWTALGIPFSIAFAMIVLKPLGVTINSVSLLGMIVVVGMIVDDAIVISENIYRHKLMGKDWVTAGIDGTTEVALPVLSTVATTVIAFLSLMNLKGMIGDFAKEVPMVVNIVLAASLIEALFVLPGHVSHKLFKSGKPIEMKDRKFIVAMTAGYKKLLRGAIKLRYVVVPLFIALFVFSCYVLFSGKVLKFVAFPSDDATAVYLSGEIREGQNLDFTSERLKTLEKLVQSYPSNSIVSYSVEMGAIGYPEYFNMEVHLPSVSEGGVTGNSLIEDFRKVADETGYFTNVIYELQTGGPPVDRSIRLEIVGNDNEKRREISDAIVAYLESLDGVKDITRSDAEKKRELKISIDYAQCAMVGVPPAVIAQTVRSAFTGTIATSLQTPEELVEYRVLLDDRYRDRLSTLDKLYVMNFQHKLIPLAPLITIREQPTVSKIDHFNGDRNTIIEADTDVAVITPLEALNGVRAQFPNFDKDYPGFRMIVGGEAKSSKETIDSMISAAVITCLAIFFILILQFKSFPQAFIVLLAIPFSFIGVALTLWAHGMNLSAMALFGGVGLIGVVVNDSIVMVDYLNSLRRKMRSKHIIDLIVDGAAIRLRAVLLTTLTTVAGLLPTAYGIGGRDQLIMPTCLVMAWGLVFATTLTLLLVPSLYMLEFQIVGGFIKTGKMIRYRKRLKSMRALRIPADKRDRT